VSEIADRHSGTLGGRLNELGTAAAPVTIAIEAGCAGRPDVQHAAWMLVNLLSRAEGVVTAIDLTGDDAPLRDRVIPFKTGEDTFTDALQRAAESVGGIPIRRTGTASAGPLLVVGPGGDTDGLRLHGEGWCGAISRGAITSRGVSRLPLGPYIAACLAAGEIFRLLRMPAERYQPIEGVSLSAWDYSRGEGTIRSVGPEQLRAELDVGLAGVGAVGCALIHSVWACPGLSGAAVIADSDKDGIDTTNLNRCVVFNATHVGARKASTAAEVCFDSDVAWEPVDGPYSRSELPRIPALLVSAVDGNRSRDQIQQGFWPARLLGASTKDLRAEVLRCGPPGVGPCLRCYNPPETDVPTDVRREQLRGLSEAELEEFAAGIGYEPVLVRRWATQGGCSELADAALEQMRGQDEPPSMFAVGFVSVLAGVLLASELIKEQFGRTCPLDDTHQTAKFQFWNPEAAANGRPQRVTRDPKCPACRPGGPGVAVWTQRALAWRPPREDCPS
jgi:ThiF family